MKIYTSSEFFFFRKLTSDLNFAEKKFLTTIFKDIETEKLTTAPTNARIPVRIKSSDPITGHVAKKVPPQVPAIVESDLNDIFSIIIFFIF
ncbi:hypothetical protein [Aequorivita sediminis]|uniref:hypothetical protein n=1 Tax=Aequorivita sediminis TaxID=3073653 RepID=UPI0028ACF78D|nr:hypothetical protein [Aequorivita sp. F6058]